MRKILLACFFFFSGFARIDVTKICGIQLFVIIAIMYLVYSYMENIHTDEISDEGAKAYKRFILWSIPGLLIGLYFARYDAIYFYVYSLLPLLLYIRCIDNDVDLRGFLVLAEISLLIVMVLGWGIHLRLLPIDFLFEDALESEVNLNYWGISYFESSRNHDYMYPMMCAAIALSSFKKESNILLRYTQLAVFFLCLLTLLASLARGGMLIVFIYLYFYVKGLSRPHRISFLCVILCLAVVFWRDMMRLFSDVYFNIFLSIFGLSTENHYGSEFSNIDRQIIYIDAIKATFQNPIGYGIENFSMTSRFNGGSAENAYLTLMVERGWIATFFFITFLWKKWRRLRGMVNRENTINFYLIPVIAVYFLFNYEFTSYMCVFIFFIILISDHKEQYHIS